MALRPALIEGVAAILLWFSFFGRRGQSLIRMKTKSTTIFLTVATKEAEVTMRKEEGGPFGAVIVRNGMIVRNEEIVNGKRCGNLLMKFEIRLCQKC
jgi:hypothetical protein